MWLASLWQLVAAESRGRGGGEDHGSKVLEVKASLRSESGRGVRLDEAGEYL